METTTTPRPVRRWPRRLLRIAGWVVLGPVLLVVLVLALLALPPVRGAVLGLALDRTQEALPGTARVEDIRWPKPGRLEIEGILWTTEADTLAVVDRLAVDVALLELLERHLHVRELTVAGARGDVPAIRAALSAPSPPEADGGAPADEPSAGLPLPRVTVDSLGIDARLRLDPERTLDAELRSGDSGAIALRVATTRQAEPEVDVAGTLDWALDPLGARLDVAGEVPGTRLERLFLAAELPDGPRGVIEADVEVAVPEVAARTRAIVDLSDGVRIVLSPVMVRQAGEDEPAITGKDGVVVIHDGAVEITGVKIGGVLGELVATASVQPGDAGVSGEADVAFALAGPRELARLFPAALPESLAVDDLGELRGTVRGTFAQRESGPEFRADLDLGETEWLERARVSAHGAGGEVVVDTLALAMAGLVVDAAGSVGSTLDVRARVELPDSSFVTRLPALRGADLAIVLDASARGPRESPDLSASLTGRATFGETEVPAVTLDVATRGDSVDVALVLPEGATHAGTVVDRLDLDAALPFPPPARPGGRLRLDADAEDLAVALALQVDSGDTLAVRVDTLGVRLGPDALGSTGPFALTYEHATGGLSVEGMRLEGAMGHVGADARWHDDAIEGDLEVVISTTVGDLARLLPTAPLPRDHALALALDGTGRLRGTKTEPVLDWSSELTVSGHEQLDSLVIALDLRAAEGGTPGERDLPTVPGVAARVSLRWPEREILRGTLRLPAELSLAPPELRAAAADTLHLTVGSEPIPLANLAPLLPPGITLAGELQVEAEARRPMSEEELQVSGFTELTGFRFDSDDGSWAEAGGRVTLAGTSRRPRVEGKITVVGGVIVIPEAPPSLLPAEGEAILWAEGSEVHLEGEVAGEGESGTSGGDDPNGRGDPPASGGGDPGDGNDAQTAGAGDPGDGNEAATGESGHAVPPGGAADSASVFAPELAVVVDCPGTVHLRGQGLALDLRGKLELEYRGDPVIVGELEAVRGTFRFLGRQFQVTRGLVTFYGDPDTDPVLDLTLEARISGTTYRVAITGDAAKPKLELSSDPQMSDGDIVASILFGKPLDQLDSGQENLLQARMLAVLAQYGADSVSGDVTRALGVDMISYNEASDGSGSGALTIGKYLNPRTLVKYEQVIGRDIAYLLRLEYALTQSIQVETAFGQGTASGIDLQWSKDY